MNPYRPPVAEVDVAPENSLGGFIPNGRVVPMGNALKWLFDACSMVFAQIGTWLLIDLVMAAIVVGAMAIAIFLAFIPVLGSLVIQIAVAVLSPMLIGGFMYAAHKQQCGGSVEVNDVFAGFQRKAGGLATAGLINFGANFAVMMVLGIVAAVVIVIVVLSVGAHLDAGDFMKSLLGTGGIVLVLTVLVFLLIYLLLATLIFAASVFAPALIMNNDLGAVEAMKRSFWATLRNWPSTLFLYPLVLTVFLLLCAMTLFGILLFAGPVVQLATYRAYHDIFYGDEQG